MKGHRGGRFAGPLITFTLATALAPSALAHNHSPDAAPTPLLGPLVAVSALVVFAGLLLARSVLGAPKSGASRWWTIFVAVVAIAATPRSGVWQPVAVAIAAASVLRREGSGRVDALLGGAVLVPLAAYGSWTLSLLMWLHLVVGSFWFGGVLQLALWHRGLDLEEGARRFARPAFVSVALAFVTGAFNTIVHTGTLHALATVLYGRLVLLKLGIVCALTLLAVAGRRLLRRGRVESARRVFRAEVATFVPVLLIAVLLASLPAPVIADAIAAGPLVRTTGGTSVVIDPYRPGTNRIHVIGTRDVFLLGRRIPLDAHGEGRIVLDGRSLLTAGGMQLALDPWTRRPASAAVVERVPNSVDCAERLQGRVLALQDENLRGARREIRLRGTGCATDADGARDAGRILGSYLRRRGYHSIDVVVGTDGRGAALRDGVGHVEHSRTDAVIVATNGTEAQPAVEAVERAPGAGARLILLAPWLFRTDLLGRWTTSGIVAAANFDPFSSVAQRYPRELVARDAGQVPSVEGLAGFAPGSLRKSLVLYVPVNVQITPGAGHSHGGDVWVGPGAGLTAVSPVLR